MPLNTQIIRDGEPMSVRWGNFHVAAMAIASALDGHADDKALADAFEKDITEMRSGARNVNDYPESLLGPDADLGIPVPASWCFQLSDYGALGACGLDKAPVLTKRYTFWDPSDDEIFTLLPGDKLVAYRGGW